MRRFLVFLVAVVLAGSVLAVGAASPAAATLPGLQSWIYSAEDGIYRVSPDGSQRQLLVPPTYDHPTYEIFGNDLGYEFRTPTAPAISPDGTRLVFSMTELFLDYPVLFEMDPENPSSMRPLGPGFVYGHSPTWSPDGAELIYSSRPFSVVVGTSAPNSFSDVLWRWHLSNGSEPVQLTAPADYAFATDADWSPNGRWVVFVVYYESLPVRPTELRLMEVAPGSTSRVIATGPVTSPSWRPDSGRIVVGLGGDGLGTHDIDASGVAGPRRWVFGSAPGDQAGVYAPSNDPGTPGDTMLIARGANSVILRSDGTQASTRGPLVVGNDPTWQRVVGAIAPVTALLPLPVVTPLTQAVLDGLAPPCPSGVACESGPLTPVVNLVRSVLRPLIGVR